MATHPRPEQHTPWYFRARGRTAIGAGVATAALAAATALGAPRALSAFAAWDGYALSQVALIVALAFGADAKTTRARCAAEDPGRRGVFALMIVATLTSLFAAIGGLRHLHDWSPAHPLLFEGVAVTAIFAGWGLVHTTYALRYARLFYGGPSAGGLDFPGDEPPDDLDFLYFALTLGMTFQTADVAMTKKRVRRAALGHTLHAFVYNTVIIAVALNVVIGNFQ